MHFTGMIVAVFWSVHPLSQLRGYNIVTAAAVAFITCIATNGHGGLTISSMLSQNYHEHLSPLP